VRQDDGQPEGRGKMRRALARLTTTRDAMHAEELMSESRHYGATSVADCSDRERATVAGTLRTVTLRPRAGVPALEAELFDGSGAVTLVWLGRRQIAGIEPGCTLEASGLVTCDGATGQRVVFNPRYTIRATGSE